MLKLVFSEAGPGPTLEAGPFEAVVIVGEAMSAGDGEQRVIATHRDHSWFVDGKRFFRVDFNRAVRVHFEQGDESSPSLGPFIHFSSADGIAYGDGVQIAHVDPDTGTWYSQLHERHWKSIVVRPA